MNAWREDQRGFPRQSQGYRTEAATSYQRALVIRERSLGVNHALTQETREKKREIG